MGGKSRKTGGISKSLIDKIKKIDTTALKKTLKSKDAPVKAKDERTLL